MWIFMGKDISQHLQDMHLETFSRKNDVYLGACDVAQGTRNFRRHHALNFLYTSLQTQNPTFSIPAFSSWSSK